MKEIHSLTGKWPRFSFSTYIYIFFFISPAVRTYFCFEDIVNYTMQTKDKHHGILTSILFSLWTDFSGTSPFWLQEEALKAPKCALKAYHLFLAFQIEPYFRKTMSFCIPSSALKSAWVKHLPYTSTNKSASLCTFCMSVSHPDKLSSTVGN